MEDRTESEWIWAKIDEYGNVTEASYLPILGSRIVPSVPVEAGVASKRVHFKVNREGMIFDGSPSDLNGHKLVLYGRLSPPLGRADTTPPVCTWRTDDEGGWTCT